MQGARMLGNYVNYLRKKNDIPCSELAELLECNEHQVHSFFKGRLHASYPQMLKIAQKLDTTVGKLLDGDEAVYKQTVVECMNDFDQDKHREEILDIIDNYIDLCDAVSEEQ